MLVIIKVIKI